MASGVYKRRILDVTVFVCGAVVMVFEIVGSRVLSPFIGTSTYIWTSLIGVILASLSLGYWLGGRMADRRPDVKVLAAFILAAGGLISLTVLLKEILLSFIAAAPMPLEIKALVAALLLFAPASICLGVVTPFTTRLVITSVEKTGSTVGRLYALSTVGSILGTFAAGFFLIPFVGSIRTLYFISLVLIVLSACLAPLAASKLNITVIMLFLLSIAANETHAFLLRQNSGLHDIDTEYGRVQVFRTKDAKTGRDIVGLATDPYFAQSAAYIDSDELVLEYSPYYHLIRHFKPDFSETLIIGGAGYSFPKEYLRSYQNARLDVVEIDPRMTAIARDHFRLTDDARMQIIHEDGRMYVNRAESDKYDAVLMDAFGSLFSVPYHLTTREAVVNLSRILKDDGVVIFNLGSAITGPGSKFLQAELRTYRDVFPNVYLFKVRSDYTDDKMQNLIIVASRSPQPAAMTSDDPGIASLLDHQYTVDLALNEPILTDDLAPVEYYNSIAQNLYLSSR